MEAHLNRAADCLKASAAGIASIQADIDALRVLEISPKIYFAAAKAPAAEREAALQLEVANFKMEELRRDHNKLNERYLATLKSEYQLKREKKDFNKRMGLSADSMKGKVAQQKELKQKLIAAEKERDAARSEAERVQQILNNRGTDKFKERHKAFEEQSAAKAKIEKLETDLHEAQEKARPLSSEDRARLNDEIERLQNQLQEREEAHKSSVPVSQLETEIRRLREGYVPKHNYDHYRRVAERERTALQAHLDETNRLLNGFRRNHAWAMSSNIDLANNLNVAHSRWNDLQAQLNESMAAQQEQAGELEAMRNELEHRRREGQCTGGIGCDNCAYHLKIALQITRAAESAALEMVDQANIERIKAWEELQEYKQASAAGCYASPVSFCSQDIVREANGAQDVDDEESDTSDEESVVFVLESADADKRAAWFQRPLTPDIADPFLDAHALHVPALSLGEEYSVPDPAPPGRVIIDAPLPMPFAPSLPVADKTSPTPSAGSASSATVMQPLSPSRVAPMALVSSTADVPPSPPTNGTSITPLGASSPAPPSSASAETATRTTVPQGAYGYARRSFLTHLTGLRHERGAEIKRRH